MAERAEDGEGSWRGVVDIIVIVVAVTTAAVLSTYWGPRSVHLEHDTLLLFCEKEPGAHGSHSYEPELRIYVPSGQSSHDVDLLRI